MAKLKFLHNQLTLFEIVYIARYLHTLMNQKPYFVHILSYITMVCYTTSNTCLHVWFVLDGTFSFREVNTHIKHIKHDVYMFMSSIYSTCTNIKTFNNNLFLIYLLYITDCIRIRMNILSTLNWGLDKIQVIVVGNKQWNKNSMNKVQSMCITFSHSSTTFGTLFPVLEDGDHV